MYKDSVQPWINASMMVIHSGCTVGVEAELSNNICIDISNVYKDQRKLGLSSQIAKYKPNNYEELKAIVEAGIIKSRHKDTDIDDDNKHLSTDTIITNNIYSLNQDARSKLKNLGHELPNKSSLLNVRNDVNQFFGDREYSQLQQINELQNISKVVESIPPLLQKSRYYTAKELKKRLKNAQKALNLKEKTSIIKLKRENVFAIIRDQ